MVKARLTETMGACKRHRTISKRRNKMVRMKMRTRWMIKVRMKMKMKGKGYKRWTRRKLRGSRRQDRLRVRVRELGRLSIRR